MTECRMNEGSYEQMRPFLHSGGGNLIHHLNHLFQHSEPLLPSHAHFWKEVHTWWCHDRRRDDIRDAALISRVWMDFTSCFTAGRCDWVEFCTFTFGNKVSTDHSVLIKFCNLYSCQYPEKYFSWVRQKPKPASSELSVPVIFKENHPQRLCSCWELLRADNFLLQTARSLHTSPTTRENSSLHLDRVKQSHRWAEEVEESLLRRQLRICESLTCIFLFSDIL